jgi:Uracil phosphoribosyltransferase
LLLYFQKRETTRPLTKDISYWLRGHSLISHLFTPKALIILPKPLSKPLSKMAAQLPPNVHVSSHPCLLGKLSQLRAATANARETKALVHEISTIVGCEALAAGLTTKSGPTVCKYTPFCFSAHVVLSMSHGSSSRVS